jgi:6,7-dimethyl-8-ribityllumazine synthase
VSERFEDRFDPERLRRLQWDGEGEPVPELGGTQAATEPTAVAEPPVEPGAELEPERQPEPEPERLPEPEPEPEPEPVASTVQPDLDDARENVFEAWPASQESVLAADEAVEEPEPAALVPPAAVEPDEAAAGPPLQPEAREHAPGELAVPPGFAVLEGEPRGERRAVGIVVARFNGEVTTRLLESALAELDARGVAREAITVMPVPGAFELPLAAMALAKTRRFACIVALGCVIRGDTPHFDYVASEAASGLQLAAIETGVPVAFGVLTLDSAEQAEERHGKGAEAVLTALEMADAFANLRTAAAR